MNIIDIKENLIKEIGTLAGKNGIQAYIVGGYVRDVILGRPRNDFDFTVIGDPIDLAKKVARTFNSKAVIFPRFRTAMVPIGEYNCEFVGTRKEIYLPDSRNPIVTEGTFEDDLRRRDFTINTIAASINEGNFGEIVDLFNGIEDIESGILRTPLDPETTFSDDPLRMMRAARFAAQLDFKVDDNSLNSINNMAERISIISQERISDEFLKTLASPKPSVGLMIMYETGLLKIIFPELNELAGVEIVQEGSREFAHKDVFRHTLKVLDNISKNTDNVWLRFAALVHDIAKPRTKRFVEGTGWTFYGHEEIGARWMDSIFHRMRFPLDKLSYVERLVRLHQRPMTLVDEIVTDSAVRRLAFQAGDALEDLFLLCRSDITTKNPNLSKKYLNNYRIVTEKVIEVQEKDKLREFQSPVRGNEIMELCNINPSPMVGYIKENIEEAILDGIIPNDYMQALDYFMKNKDKWMIEYEELNSK